MPRDIARELAERAAAASTQVEYEADVLDVLGRTVGYDVAMFVRPDSGPGAHTVGLDEAVVNAWRPRWSSLGEGLAPFHAHAAARGVGIDRAYFGDARLERLPYYQALMRPHNGRCTALAYLTFRGQVVASVILGRTSPGFRAREINALKGLLGVLTIGEVAQSARPRAVAESSCALVSLTAREAEIATYLPLGYTNQEIALACGTSPKTVRNQLTRIYQKLGVTNRAEAVGVLLKEAQTAGTML